MSEQLGIGVMIRMLSGNDASAKAMQAAIGKQIASVSMVEDELRFVFTDKSRLTLADRGQSCCESRYMTCDADLAGFVGATLLSAEVADAPNVGVEYDEHEVQFLIVKTDRGNITAETHNEHNGYYGGFSVEASAK